MQWLKGHELLHQDIDPERDAEMSLGNQLGWRRCADDSGMDAAVARATIASSAIPSPMGAHFDFQYLAVIGLLHDGEGLAAAGTAAFIFRQVNHFVLDGQMVMLTSHRTGVALLLPAPTMGFRFWSIGRRGLVGRFSLFRLASREALFQRTDVGFELLD